MDMVKRGMSLVLAAGIVAGCATAGPPPAQSVAVYPAKGQSADQQARDSSECDTWSRQQTGYDPTTETAKGAGIGAVLGAAAGAATGAAVGAITGSPGRGAAAGAVIGGVGGAAVGGGMQYSKSKEGWEKAYAACMQGRGYSVSR
ncbi:MAG: hypothetical protein HY728_08885 [Candidatus Rokubacteria bacterium]|nr:hypothetical protein [Candidatus Rokubacteria bacterium]MBI4594317.1 hypothetical protein [Candidatus Rokubacteria bacterium]